VINGDDGAAKGGVADWAAVEKRALLCRGGGVDLNRDGELDDTECVDDVVEALRHVIAAHRRAP